LTFYFFVAEQEGGLKLGAAIQQSGLKFVWLPIQGADLPTRNAIESFHEKIQVLARLISEENAVVLIHCSGKLPKHKTIMD
jgi:hypothetical protein